MGIDNSDGDKRRGYKKGSKAKKKVKKYSENISPVKIQPTGEGEDNGKKMEGKPIQHAVGEKNKIDIKNDMVNKEKSELHSIEKEVSDLVKSQDASTGVPVEEEIQTSESEAKEEYSEQGPALSLIEMLKHKDGKVRAEALESLLRIGDKSVCYAFAGCMKDENYKVRLGALRGLYRFGGDLAVDYLVSALEDEYSDVRRRAVIYLGWLRKKELVPYITGALADSSPLVRKVATYSLGDIKNVSAVPHLIKALDDTDQDVKKGALSALKRITKKSFDSDLDSAGEINQETSVKWKEWWRDENK